MRDWRKFRSLTRGRARGDRLHEAATLGDVPMVEGFSPDHLSLRKDEPPPLSHPPLASPQGLPPDEFVFGVQRAGEARVYPASMLRGPHIVNDVVGEDPLVVTFCPRCMSAAAFDPRVEGKILTFRAYGAYQGTMVMQDEQSGGIWSPVTGECLAGPLARHRLRAVPLEATALEPWLARHPDSLVPEPALSSGGSPPATRPLRAWQRKTISHWDDRLDPETRVLGIAIGDRARAYVVDPDRPGPRCHQDDLGGIPIVLLAAPGAWPNAFDRRTQDGTIEFITDGDELVDASGSTWTEAGRALSGLSAGRTLRFIPTLLTNWYAWAGYHPGTEVARFPPS